MYSEIETVEMHHHEFSVQFQGNSEAQPYPGMDKVCALSTDLNDLFFVFCDNLKKFAEAVDNPKGVVCLDFCGFKSSRFFIDWAR